MKLSKKVKNTLKDNNISFEDINDLDYDKIISKLNLYDLRKECYKEYLSLEEQLDDSMNRKYLYLLIEKIKNNMDEPKAIEVGEFIKDKETDYLLENVVNILNDYNIEDLLDAYREEREIRTDYLSELVQKKHLLLLLEHLESM